MTYFSLNTKNCFLQNLLIIFVFTLGREKCKLNCTKIKKRLNDLLHLWYRFYNNKHAANKENKRLLNFLHKIVKTQNVYCVLRLKVFWRVDKSISLSALLNSALTYLRDVFVSYYFSFHRTKVRVATWENSITIFFIYIFFTSLCLSLREIIM